MSYDICILKSHDPYADPVAQLDVQALIAAINSFGPFEERGITWANKRWSEFPPWEGLVVDLEDHIPACVSPAEFDYGLGEARACNMHVAYGTVSDLRVCMELALHIASAIGANAWDLQLDRLVEPSAVRVAIGRWTHIRNWLRSVVGVDSTESE